MTSQRTDKQMNSATEYNDEQAYDTNANANKGPANTTTSTVHHPSANSNDERANTTEYECAATNTSADGIKHSAPA